MVVNLRTFIFNLANGSVGVIVLNYPLLAIIAVSSDKGCISTDARIAKGNGNVAKDWFYFCNKSQRHYF